MSKYRSYEDARKFVRSLKLKKDDEWRQYAKSGNKPKDIPADPRYFYKNEWTGIGDWLGTDSTAYKNQKWRSYSEAKKFVHSLNLSDRKEWDDYCKSGNKPKDIPVSPYNVYKKECKGMGDWLGTGRIQNQKRKYRSFLEAKKFAHSLKLQIRKDWIKFTKSGNKPQNIPTDPMQVYKKEWDGWGDWLGTGRISSQVKSTIWLPWKQAKIEYRNLAKEHGLNNKTEWDKFAKTHKEKLLKLRLPQDPWRVYTKERVWSKIK